MEIWRVEKVRKVYGKDDTEIKALNDVSFSIERGEFVAIIGASGSGKSTLLHIIGGIDTPTTGKVYIEKTDISKLDENSLTVYRRRNIGFIYQFYNLVPVLNVKENIELPILLDYKKLDKNETMNIIKMLKLEDRIDNLPSQLSGGQQQKVAIGRAIITKPSIILADEPTGNLDTKNSNEIIDYLKYSCKKFNQTILMVTHNLDIALQADRIIKLEDGKIIFDKKNI